VQKILQMLDLAPGSSEESVNAACQRILARLAESNFQPGTRASGQAAQCRWALEHAHAEYKQSPDKEQEVADNAAACSLQPARPRLGQMCVASGMISINQLEEAVEAQVRQDMALGEVLQLKGFISQAELDGLLLGQEMIDVPSACVDALGKRLILLGLVSEDMVYVSQMQSKAVGESIGDILIRHGWVEPQVLSAITACELEQTGERR
jgi:hypothetical protein